MLDQLTNKHVLQWVGFTLIAIIVLLVYGPSLAHVPRGDQVVYLSEISSQKNLFDLTIANTDLNRKSMFNSGDEILFRPLLYVILGAEKYFFGYDFFNWQLVGILLHLLIVFLFLKICLDAYVGIPALVFTTLFALFFPNIEMVVWHHLHAYLLAFVLLLIALHHTIKLIKHDSVINLRLSWINTSLLLASFIYEVVVLYTILIAVFLWIVRPDLRVKLRFLLFIPFFYLGLSIANLFFAHHLQISSQGGDLVAVIVLFIKTLGWWIYSGLLYFLYPVTYGSRLMLAPEDVLAYKPLDITSIPALVTVALVVGFLGLLGLNKKSFWRIQQPILLLFLGMICVYVLMIAGRASINGAHNILRFNLYNQYMFWLLTLLLVFYAIDWIEVKQRAGLILKFLTLLVMGYILISGYLVYVSNFNRAVVSQPAHYLIKKTENLIEKERLNTNLSFYVAPSISGNEIYHTIRKKDDAVNKQYSYIELLYSKYFNSTEPKYVYCPDHREYFSQFYSEAHHLKP